MAIPSRGAAAALVVALGAFLAFHRLGETPLVDPDEGRYAVAAAGMLETGDFIVPRLDGEPRLNKPPLFYWLVSLSMVALGMGEAAARLPSAAAGLAVIFALLVAGRRRGEPAAGLFAASVVATAPLGFGGFHLAVPDGVMAALVSVALLVALEVHEGRLAPWPGTLLAASALGLAALAKGHVPLAVFLVVEGAYALLQRGRVRAAFGPLAAGLALVVVLLAPWVLGVVLRVGWEPLRDILVAESGRIAGGAGHPEPWHFYLLRHPLVLLPWTGFLAVAVLLAWPRRRESGESFALAWALAPFLLFSLSRGKHNLYLLPSLPGAALLVGLAWAGRGSGGALVDRRRLVPVAVLTSALVAAGTAFLLLQQSSRRFFEDHQTAVLAAASALVVLLVVLAWARRGALLAGALALFMAALLVLGLQVTPEALGRLRSTRALVEAYRAAARAGDDVVLYRASTEDHASLLFYLGRRVETVPARDLAARRLAPGRLFVICGEDDHARLPDHEIGHWEGPLERTRNLALYREVDRPPPPPPARSLR